MGRSGHLWGVSTPLKHTNRVLSIFPINSTLPPPPPPLSSKQGKMQENDFLKKIRGETHRTWWLGWRDDSWRRAEGLNNVLFCLSKMAKNEISAKVSKNSNTNVLQQSQSIQNDCNRAGDILVWDFLPPFPLFKTPRTQWFDNDLIARYLPFEYSEATLSNRFSVKSLSMNTVSNPL